MFWIQAHDDPLHSLRWSRGGEWMLSGDGAGVVKYWQARGKHNAPSRTARLCPGDAQSRDSSPTRLSDPTRRR
jgi:hypothetical protein